MEGMTDGGTFPECKSNQEVGHECQRVTSPGIPRMEPLYETAVPLPHVRLLLGGTVCACLPAADADHVRWVATALSGSDMLLPCAELKTLFCQYVDAKCSQQVLDFGDLLL
jgi:hypothetical protein